MRKQSRQSAGVLVVVAMAIAVTGYAIISSVNVSAEPPAPDEKSAHDSSDAGAGEAGVAEFKKELFAGKVVLAQEALKRRGIKVADELKTQAVLETESGELIPIAADWRGRAFYQDKRIRDRKVELVGYRRPGIPYLQVLIIFVLDDKGRRQEMDYWCEICAIPMYEIKQCECCQADITLRFRDGKLPSYLTKPNDRSQDASEEPTPPGGKSTE